MKRLDQLPANQLITQITSMRQALDQLKSQQIAGNDDIRLTRTVTGNPVDFTVNISYHTVTAWEVAWTPADTTFAYSGWVWRSFQNYTTASGSGDFLVYGDDNIPDGNGQQFFLYFMGTTPSMSLTFDFAVVIYAIGTGTISFTQIL